MTSDFLRPGQIFLMSFLPGWLTAGITIFSCALAYFALLYFAYRRSYVLPKNFHLLCLVFGVLIFVSSTLYAWPAQYKLPTFLFSAFAFLTCLLGAYMCLAAVDLFVTDYYLGTVRQIYISPPMRKLIRVIGFVVAGFISMNAVFNFNPLTRLATLSVGGLAIGLALQDTLKGIIAGLSLGQLLRVGDWVRIKGMDGQVLDLSWARLTLRTKEGDQVFIPNKELQQMDLLNYTLGHKAHRARLQVSVNYSTDPDKVKLILLEAARSLPDVLKEPAPETYVSLFGEAGVVYDVFFWLDDYNLLQMVTDKVASRIWHVFRRKGLEIPFPTRIVQAHRRPVEHDLSSETETWISSVDLFRALPAQDRLELAKTTRREMYLPGEYIFHQGDPGTSLFLIMEGKAAVMLETPGAALSRITELSVGSFFGEMSLLTGEKRSASVVAETTTHVLVVAKESLQAILARLPNLADQLAQVVLVRKADLDSARQALPSRPLAAEEISSVASRIRRFFGLGR